MNQIQKLLFMVQKMRKGKNEGKTNAEEGGTRDFWGDIDSEVDDVWAAVTCRRLGLIDTELNKS